MFPVVFSTGFGTFALIKVGSSLAAGIIEMTFGTA